jgi:energy-coupling factor transporter ATP-binding protein EcfA2
MVAATLKEQVRARQFSGRRQAISWREVKAMSASVATTIPIGLREITIQDFRGIDHLQLSFADAHGGVSDIVVLAGPNGSGKTAVLEACLLATGNGHRIVGTTGPWAKRAGATDFPRIAAKVHRFDEEYSANYRGMDGLLHWHNETKGQTGSPGAIECLYFSSWRAPRLVGAVPITAGQAEKRPADVDANRLALGKQYLVNARAHALMRATALPARESSPYEMAITKLNQVWRRFYPDGPQQFTVEPVGSPEEGFDVFLTGPDQQRLPLDMLSSGQLELFTLFSSLLRLKFQRGLVVIDEPELHLDPQWHGLMLRALQHFLPQAQLIVATHSPQIYDSVFSFQRHFLIPPGDPRAIAWKSNTQGEEA